MIVTISETILNDKEISDQAFAYYVGLKWYCPGEYFSLKAFVWTITGNTSKDIKSYKEVINTIKYVDLIYVDQGLFKISIINPKDKYFAYINIDDYLQIMRSNKKNKYGIIRFLCLLNKCMNNNKVQLPETYYAAALDVSRKTISDYIKYLEYIRIIKVNRFNKKENNIITLE